MSGKDFVQVYLEKTLCKDLKVGNLFQVTSDVPSLNYCLKVNLSEDNK